MFESRGGFGGTKGKFNGNRLLDRARGEERGWYEGQEDYGEGEGDLYTVFEQ